MEYKLINMDVVRKLYSQIASLREELGDTIYDDEPTYRQKQEHLSFLQDLHFDMTKDVVSSYGATKSNTDKSLECNLYEISVTTKYDLGSVYAGPDGLSTVYIKVDLIN